MPTESEGAGPSVPAGEPRPDARSRKRRRAQSGSADHARSPQSAAAPDILEPDAEDEAEDAGGSDTGGRNESDVLDVPSGVHSLPSLPAIPASGAASEPSLPTPVSRPGALERFLAQVGRYPVLTPEEERELTMAYYERQDPVAARKLVVHNLRLVVKMAYKYRRAWASVLDLIQEGNVGLVEAVQRYDPFKGAKFSTYATFWIRAYMLRFLLEHSRMVRLARSRVGRKLFFQLSKERAKLRAQGVDPGPKLLAERLGVDQDELEQVVQHMDQAEVYLDAPMGDDSSGSVLDGMIAEGATPEAQAYRSELNADLSRAFESFAESLTDPRERAAWTQHLMAEDPVSLSELGAEFGVTKQRMGQIVSNLRKRLKSHLVQTLGEDVQLGFSLEE